MLYCRLCDFKHETNISHYHIKKHGLTTKEYKALYPDAIMRIQSEETRQKIANKNKGKLTGRKRGSPSEETKEKQRIVMKEKFLTGDIVHWNLGKKTSEETKRKISESNKAISHNIGNIKQREAKHERIKSTAKIFDCSIIDIDDAIGIVHAQCNKCNHVFKYTQQIFYPNRIQKINKLCPSCQPRITFSSQGEKEIATYIRSIYDGIIIENERELLGGKEIDIYLPELKIGFEYTGLYWHSEKQNPEKNHLLWKMQFAYNQGVRLISIYEDEWKISPEIVKSRISNILGKTHKIIYARKCVVKNVETHMKNDFLSKNHIQNKDTASISLGLFYCDELVSIATFRKTNIVKGGDGSNWELSRFCNKCFTTVVGGASRLISHFLKNNTDVTQLISYADRRWSQGDLYKKIGFNFDSVSQPSYWYTLEYKKRMHRSNYMKHILVNKYKLDSSKTEWELAKEIGLDRIWDCGTTKWVYHVASSNSKN